MNVTVLGGTRFMGRRIVSRLLHDGHAVTIVHRGNHAGTATPGVTEIVGDRSDLSVLAAVKESEPDAVVDMSAYTAQQCAELLDAVGDVSRWVHCSTGAVYEQSPVFPWVEDSPYGPWALWGQYGIEKLGCELLLRDRRSAQVSVVFRPPYVLGPGNYAAREEFILNRLLDDAEILIQGDGEGLLHMVSADEIGQMFASAVTHPLSPGFHPFNAAGSNCISSLGLVHLLAEICGTTPRVRHISRPADGTPFDTADHVFPFPDVPYVLDGAKLVEHGLVPQPTPLTDVLHESFEYLMRNPSRRTWTRTAAELSAASQSAAAPARLGP